MRRRTGPDQFRVMWDLPTPERRDGEPAGRAGVCCGLMLYVEDVDSVFERAVTAGGKAHQPVKDQFYGDRSGTLIDPFGHMWTVATHVEDVAPEEMERRMEAARAEAR